MPSAVTYQSPTGNGFIKFGVLLDHQYRKGTDLTAKSSELVETAQVTRDLGYDSIFALHHYIAPLATLQPLALLSRLIDHTGKMQIGTGILILPMVHPVHYAEELATIDQMSGGRLILGVGAGYRDPEFRAFGLDKTEKMGRMWEGLDVMRKLWAGGEVTHTGKYFDLKDVACSVLPAQGDQVPIWIGSGHERTIARAGSKGYSWVVSSSAKGRWARGNLEEHLRARREAGFTGPHTAAVHRDLWIGDDEQSAFDDVKDFVSASAREYAPFGMPWLQSDFEDRSKKAGLFGSPEEIAMKIREYAAAGFDHFVFRVQWLDLPIERSYETLERFQREVAPLLASSRVEVSVS